MSSNQKCHNWSFYTFLFAAVFAIVGIDIFAFTHTWRILELSNRQELIGVSWSLIFLPSVLVQPFAPRLFNRVGHARIWLRSEGGRAALFLLGCFVLHFFPRVEMLFTLCFLFGLSFVPFYPTIYVLLKEDFSEGESVNSDVSEKRMLRANSIFEVSIQLAGVLSIVCASVAYESYGFEKLLLVASVSSLLSAVSVFIFLKLRVQKRLITDSAESTTQEFIAIPDVRQQFRSSPRQFLFGVFHQVPQALIFASNVPLVLLIRDVYKGGPAELGYFDAFYSAIGIIVSVFWTKFFAQSRSVYYLSAICLLTTVSAFYLPLSEASRPLFVFWFALFSVGLTSAKIQSRAVLLVSNSTEMLKNLSTLYQMSGNLLTLLFLFGMTYLLAEPGVGVRDSYFALGLGSVTFAVMVVVLLRWRLGSKVCQIAKPQRETSTLSCEK